MGHESPWTAGASAEEGHVWTCETCGGRAEELARTQSLVWRGCRSCQRMWNTEHGPGPEAIGRALQMPPSRARVAHAFVLAGLAVAAAALLRELAAPLLGDASPFLLFTPAIAVATLYEGPVAGGFATLFGGALGSHLFLQPPGEQGIDAWDHIALFLLVGALIATVSTLSRNSRTRLADVAWREMMARARAEAADRSKDDFLALVSHELRTPVSVVLGWATAVRTRALSGTALERALGAIERNARVQHRLVSDILDRSRMVTGSLRLTMAPVRLRAVIAAAAEQVQAETGTTGAAIRILDHEADVVVDGDDMRLQQVCVNLLTNALKFTPAAGLVTIELRRSGAWAEIVVSDTGAGIAPEFLPHVFDAFRQAENTLAQSRQGLGLGLSLVRHIVEGHGGSVAAESAGRGLGATFTVSLPAAGPSPAEPPPARLAPRHAEPATVGPARVPQEDRP